MSDSIQGKCDVLILSGNYGTGHILVSESIKQSILEMNPEWKVEIYDFFKVVDPFLGQVVEFSYHQLIKYFSPGYSLFYQATRQIAPDSNWQKHLNSIGQKEIYEFISKKSPKVIVCTFPTPAGVISSLKGAGKIDIPLITVITDVVVHSQWLHPYVDYYLVASDSVVEKMEYRGIPRSKVFVTGIPLRPQFQGRYDREKVLIKYGLSPSLPVALICGGGKGMMTGMSDLARKLGKMKTPLQIVIITGQNKALARRLQIAARLSHNPMKILGFVENMAELMECCDAFITKAGGVTVFEALAKGIPMIIYKPIPGHEEANSHFLLQNGAARRAKNCRQIRNIMEEFIAIPPLREKICKNIAKLAKPMAARDAALIITNVAKGLQCLENPANKSDIMDNHWRYA